MFGAKVFKYLLKIPLVIFIIAFVVLNQQETTFYYSPLASPLILPMWIMGLVLFGIGFMFGALLLWLNSWPTRRSLKQTQKELKKVEKDRDDLKTKLDQNEDKSQNALEYKDTSIDTNR
jgi:uncharacterized membrane protein YciS (DUF1049 family)